MEDLLSVLKNKYNVNGDYSIYRLTKFYNEVKITAYGEIVSVIDSSDYLYQFKNSFKGKKYKIKDVLPEKAITRGIKIHFDDKCSIPPKVLGSDVKRASSIDKTDITVIPCNAIMNILHFKIYIDYSSYNIFIVSEETWECIDNGVKFRCYDEAICDSMINSMYVGDEYVVLSELDDWSLSVINNPNKGFVTEKTIFENTNERENCIIKNILDVKNILMSSDQEIVSVGIKSLAILNYMKFPFTTSLVLNETQKRWRFLAAKDTITVKYMLNYLFGKYNVKCRRFEVDYNKVGDDELDFYRENVTSEIKNWINGFLSNIDFSFDTKYNFDLSIERKSNGARGNNI